MREIVKITIALTISCLIAGLAIGTTFIFTAKAKQHNEHLYVEQTMLGLLGYGKHRPAPSDLRLHQVHRYLIKDAGTVRVGYLLPVRAGVGEGFELLVLDLQGQFLDHRGLTLTPADAQAAEQRQKALVRLLGPAVEVRFADTLIIACRGGGRMAYLLPGEFPGFKTFIKAMVALGADFEILGLEVIEHEEDPGLGAEITRAYFKNQFIGKSFDTLKTLAVVKEPLPEAYKTDLERIGAPAGGLSAEDVAAIAKNYQDKDIYALTGATISSAAVTNGVKGMVKKFAYRIQSLDRAIGAGNIKVLF